MPSPEVLIIAAEASSSLFALRLLQHWKKNSQNIKAFGVGSNDMELLGFERLGRAEDMAVMGLAEIREHYSEIKAVFHKVIAEAKSRRPKVAIIMDYPGFNLKLAKELKALGIPVVYYIPPQVWAWKKGRVKTIKKYCDRVISLFPFEKKFYDAHGVPCDFVGHPMLDELEAKLFDQQYRKVRRNKCGILDDEIVIGLMPGSRKGEVRHHLETQFEVAKRLYKTVPKIKILLMVAPTLTKDQMKELIGDVRIPFILQKDDPFEMINLCDVILAASGTATLMVGLLHKPMVVMYKFNWLTAMIAKIIVKGVKFFCIVNLIHDREVVPERWQENANPDELYRLMKRFLEDQNYRLQVVRDLEDLDHRLGEKGATERVAKVIGAYL